MFRKPHNLKWLFLSTCRLLATCFGGEVLNTMISYDIVSAYAFFIRYVMSHVYVTGAHCEPKVNFLLKKHDQERKPQVHFLSFYEKVIRSMVHISTLL